MFLYKNSGVFVVSLILISSHFIGIAHAGLFDDVVNKVKSDFEKINVQNAKNGSSQVSNVNDASDQVDGGNISPDEIIRQLASQNMSPYCAASFLQKSIDQAMDAYKMGKFSTAAGQAKIQAQNISACSLKNGGVITPNDRSMVGQLLAVSAIGNREAGLNAYSNTVTALNAMTLLKLDAGGNQEIISQLEKSGALPQKAPVSDANSALTMSALDMVTKFQKNSFSFNRENKGKTLGVNGVIKNISGGENTVYITIIGVVRSNKDEQRHQDDVSCYITESNAMKTAMTIEKGKMVSVQGLFSPKPMADSEIVLHDCRIVR
jgi:hypothetical protein